MRNSGQSWELCLNFIPYGKQAEADMTVSHIFAHTCSCGRGRGTSWSTMDISIASGFGFLALSVITAHARPHDRVQFSPTPKFDFLHLQFFFFLIFDICFFKNLLVNQQWADTCKIFGDNENIFICLLILFLKRINTQVPAKLRAQSYMLCKIVLKGIGHEPNH